MTRTSTVVWSLIGVVIVLLGILGAIYGPDIYRDGKAIVGPIVDIAKSEERLATLNTEMPFDEPVDGTVGDDRFSVFLDIRRDLLPRYVEWQEIERRLEQHDQQDWGSAMEVLAAIQGVMTMQIETLETHGMAPAEFIWIEDLAYVTWAERVEDIIEVSAVTEKVRETTATDMEALAELENRFGSSRTSREFGALLERRLQSLDNPDPPTVDGVSDATSSLLWAHREELADLDLVQYSELHDILRGNNTVNINIDSEDE